MNNTGKEKNGTKPSSKVIEILNKKRNQAILASSVIALAIVSVSGLILKQHLNNRESVMSQTITDKTNSLYIGECRLVNGDCGAGMFNQPTFFLDRVSFSCPNEAPIMVGFRFARCGELGTDDEGLQIVSKCCNLAR